MHINQVKTAFKVAEVILDKEHKERKIKFIFLDKIKDENKKIIDKKILKEDTGRIYLLVSDGIIKKIGGSQCKGGIKTTMSFYQGGMQGGPSIRTFGIHLLLEEELKKGKKVEVYMINLTKQKAKVKGLFDEDLMDTTSFKESENKCKKDYKLKEGDYPPWNFQEKGKPWRQDIQLKWDKHNKTRKSFNRKK